MNYGIIQNRRHDTKRAGNNGGASALLQDTRLREMARQMGLDAKDFGHEAAGNLWQLLDDMATNDPGAYQKFIREQLKDGPPMASQQKQADNGDDDDELQSTSTSSNQGAHDATKAKSPVVLLPRYFAPYPGFVVKCAMLHTVKCQQQETKLFLNCCAHEMVDTPKNPNNGKDVPEDTRAVPSTSNLEIPLVVGKLRDDVQDVSGSVCVACDVVFHPWVMRRCEWDANFKREVMKLAIQWVQQDAKVRLVNQVGKFIKSRYKGGSVVGTEIVTAKFLVDPSALTTTTSASSGSDNQSEAAGSEQEHKESKSQTPSVIESPSELLKQIHLKRNDGATTESPGRDFLIKPVHETTASAITKNEPIASVSAFSCEQKISTPASKSKLIQELDPSSPLQTIATSKPQQAAKAKGSAVKKGFLLGATKAKAPLYPTGSSEGRAPSAYVNLLSRSKVVDLSDVERQKKQQEEETRKLRDEFEFLSKPNTASSSSGTANDEVDCGDFEFEQLCMDADPDLKSSQQQHGASSIATDDPARQLFGEDFEQISKFLSM
ncbi:hypothetical protein Gpo141_00007137 [Globisporangium polare]